MCVCVRVCVRAPLLKGATRTESRRRAEPARPALAGAGAGVVVVGAAAAAPPVLPAPPPLGMATSVEMVEQAWPIVAVGGEVCVVRVRAALYS